MKLFGTPVLSNAIRKQGRMMWKICILLVKCALETSSLPLNQTNPPMINSRNMSSERIQKF